MQTLQPICVLLLLLDVDELLPDVLARHVVEFHGLVLLQLAGVE